MSEPVITTHLELLDPADLQPPARPAPPGLSIERVEHVAKPAAWWQAHAEAVETWIARLDGALAGYAELESRDGDVEIAYLGLLPAFHGRGIGGHLLSHAIRRGFELGPRVWLHTCTLDGPHALDNYEARGMRIFRVEP
jgi:ribosomal protein S18 acetylase RimI-like enzyme